MAEIGNGDRPDEGADRQNVQQKAVRHSAPYYKDDGQFRSEIEVLLASEGVEIICAHGEMSILARPEQIVTIMKKLRHEGGYQQLMEIAGVDYPEREQRFEVAYHLLSLTKNHRLRVKVRVGEGSAIASLTPIWEVANWLEREVFDLYGVFFDGHPDLRRILTDYGFQGHPFRRDFPLTGYQEMRYSEEHKRVIYEPVKLAQDFRDFDFTSPWEGSDYILPGDEKVEEIEKTEPQTKKKGEG